MAIETAKDSLVLNQIIDQKTDTILIEEDCIVPDIKPDILNVISTSGIICMYKKEILDGKVRLDGCINTYIMYLADTQEENAVRGLNTNLDFTQTIEIEKATSSMSLDTNLVLKSLDCKVLNGRKIHMKAIIEVEAKVSSNETVEYVSEIQNLKDIQLLNQDFQINSLIGTGSTRLYAKDTFTIDQIDNLVEVMKTDLKIVNKDTKISYNKVLIKADLETKILYLTEDNRINVTEGKIPIMGFIDLPNISEEHTCDVKYEIKNLIVKPNNVEEHSIYVEAEIEVYCEAYENRELKMIQDLYSPTTSLNFSKKRIRVIGQKESRQQVCSIREKEMLPEIGPRKIYDVEVYPMINKQNTLNGRILYEGEVELNFIYSAGQSNGIETKQISIPFNFSMDFEGMKPEMSVDTIVEISLQDFVIMPDESIDIKVDLTFTAISSKNSSISIIEEIQEAEECKNKCQYSMVIYFTKPGDSLWKIAKRFGSTVEDIARVNGIEDVDNIPVGKQLFIPRYHG